MLPKDRAADAKPVPASADDGLEFELIEVADARRILDTESMSQFDTSSVDRPEHWKRLRRASQPTDRALAGYALDWLTALPGALRPHALSREFPRIVNALAAVWDEPVACQATLDKLLSNGRPGRAGFPPAVQAELVALRDWVQVF